MVHSFSLAYLKFQIRYRFPYLWLIFEKQIGHHPIQYWLKKIIYQIFYLIKFKVIYYFDLECGVGQATLIFCEYEIWILIVFSFVTNIFVFVKQVFECASSLLKIHERNLLRKWLCLLQNVIVIITNNCLQN